MKPLLVGEQNPYGADPRYALYPEPRGCAGWRLCNLVMELRTREYIATFDRVNLLDSDGRRWSAPAAREAADRIRAGATAGRVVVLLGARVAAAFGLPGGPFTTELDRSGLVAVRLPHPSGLCRVWNEPGAFARARDVLRAAGALPESP